MNSRLRLSPTDAITIAGIIYRPVDFSIHGLVLERSDQSGITVRYTYQELAGILSQPDVRYFSNYFDLASSSKRLVHSGSTIAELGAETRSLTLWRQAICDTVLKLEHEGKIVRTYASLEAISPTLNAIVYGAYEHRNASGSRRRAGMKHQTRLPPSAKTILRWLRRYEDFGFDPIALVPFTYRSGNRSKRWCHLTEARATEVIGYYASTQRPTKKQAVAATRTKIIAENEFRRTNGKTEMVVPSERSLLRRLATADPYAIYASRWGTGAANKKFNLYETGIETLFPGERVEMDEHRLDVISLLTTSGIVSHLSKDQIELLKDRRWIYVAKDCATKCILAIRLAKTPCAQEAVLTLRDVFSNRTAYATAAKCESAWDQVAGVGTIVTDQGSAFISEEFRSVVSSIGTSIHFPPAGLPQMRGNIESFFGTLGKKLMPLLSGRTFFNPVARGDYPSEQLAALNDDDLIQILISFVVDVYHNEPHGGLKGETPANCWKRLSALHGVLPLPDGLSLRVAFGNTHMRRIRGDGVLFAGLSYSCDAIRHAFLHSPEREVEIRVDLLDLGWIAIRLGNKWYAARCNHAGFDGMRYIDWLNASRALRLEHKKAASLSSEVVSRALARIQQTDRDAALRMQLTPFRVSDAEIARNESSLHFSLSTSVSNSPHINQTGDPLQDGITIAPHTATTQSSHTTSSQKSSPTKSWRFDDE